MKEINLSIDQSISGLAGFPYGKEIFEKQVSEKLSHDNGDEQIIIVFPNKIKRITSSFVQGFFADLLERYGYYGVVNKVKVKTSSEKLSKSIFEVLE